MAQVCGKCRHVNPPDASYCYFDGVLLAGHGSVSGPIQAGSVPFPNQFFFPNGQVCRNFDQLAMTCNDQWASAVDLLKQGFLASFFGGLGRADLARAAQEAARFPDIDRGLDQLLAKLPSQTLESPKLQAEPTEVNLGQLQIGQNHSFELHLSNLGQRLLYGSAISDSKWLTFGEGAGKAQKVFQFNNDAVIPIQVRGQHLRAGTKPLEGQLVVDSNGGTMTIRVRVEVPVKPFSEGVLAGAITPRQVAEKAKAQPKEAAVLFEKGRVAEWFKSNGWTYPVQGPSASGLGAVQQFFEALGLATAPKVEISEKQLLLAGNPGQPLHTTLRVETQEKRPVYAHATCADSWIDVKKTTLNGRVAIINVVVPRVPNRPGERLQTKIHIQANGNQRFGVPVTLQISGTPGAYLPEVLPVDETMPVQGSYTAPGMPTGIMPPPKPQPGIPYDGSPPRRDSNPFIPLPVSRSSTGGPPPLAGPRPTQHPGLPTIVHLLPAGVLMLALLAVLTVDFLGLGRKTDDGVEIDPTPRVESYFFQDWMTFGLVAPDPVNPRKNLPKRLTYDQLGRTNTTVIRLDGKEQAFGLFGGKWENRPTLQNNKGSGATKAIWLCDGGVRVTQTVEVIPGEPIEITPERYQRHYDTCLVRYTLECADNRPHNIGLRIMVDTLIGDNDGVPFTVPGRNGLVDVSADFKAQDQQIPAFIQVLERGDLKNPGLVAQMGLVLGGKLESPSRVSLTHWQDKAVRWEVPMLPIRDDSCVVIYWNERELKPGEKRELGFTYGLGSVSSKSGQLGVTVGGNFVPGGELTVVGLVSQPKVGEKLTLKLPEGVRFLDGSAATQDVPPAQGGRPVPVTWRIVASSNGSFIIEVNSNEGVSQKKRITIRAKGIF